MQPRWNANFYKALSRVKTDGVGLPSHACLLAINGLIYRHTISGFWNELDQYYNFRHDGPEAFGYYNLHAHATFVFTITKSGTVTFTPKVKVAFQGTAGYYDTHYSPSGFSGKFTVLGGARGVGIIANPGGGSFVYGTNGAGVRYDMVQSNLLQVNAPTGTAVSPTSGSINAGKWVFRRVNSTQVSFNKNGVADGILAQNVDAGVSPNAMYLGVRNNGGAAGTTGVEMSYWWGGETISDTTALAAYNAETEFENLLSTI